MNQDADLLRAILLAVEEKPAGHSLSDPEFTGYDNLTIGEHVELLVDNDFIEANVKKIYGPEYVIVIERLTSDGRKFLQAAKDENIWNSAKNKIIKETSSWTISLLYEYLKQEAKNRLGLP